MTDTPSGLPPTPPPPPSPSGPSKPADYYSGASGDTKKSTGCRNWAIGCGGAGCLVLIILFAGGAWLVTRGMPTLVDYVFKDVETKVAQSGVAAATPEQKEALHDQVLRLRGNLESGTIGPGEVQSLIENAAQAASDGHVTSEELTGLIDQLKKVNDRAEHRPPGKS